MTKLIEMKDLIKVEMVEDPLSDWVNGIIPNCERCGTKFAEDGHNYNERDGDEICDDCEEEIDFSVIIYDECLECKMPKNPYHQKNSTCGKIEKECPKVTWTVGETYEEFIKRMEIY